MDLAPVVEKPDLTEVYCGVYRANWTGLVMWRRSLDRVTGSLEDGGASVFSVVGEVWNLQSDASANFS